MTGHEPPYLTVGTDVSAKYKGAFCEAKVKKVNRSVKVKVILKECHTSIIVTDDTIKGQLVIGASVEVKQPSNGQFVDAVVNKLTDSSIYTVVFDDGDEATLRRSQLCLKGDKHFTESETLDNLPLSHPEHFGTPVLQKKTKKVASSGNNSESEEESESDDSIPKRQNYRGRQQELVGKVMVYESTERRKSGPLSVPVLIVLPDAHDTDLRTKDHILVRSFKDNKFTSVLRKELKDFSRDTALKNETNALKTAMDKALCYFENRELPSSWKREDLLGSDEENDEDESSDDEQNEEKDRFVAQLYKFMDDRGTPINKGPSVGVHDLNLYRLFKIVQNFGGYNKVTNLDKWRLVYNKMGLPSSNLASSQMKNAYKKFLHAFEDFYRKLGSTMGTLSRPGRQRNNSGRNIMPFRGRDKETSSSPRVKKEEKEIDDSSSEKSKTPKSDDTSDTDSLFKEESDNETIKRSVTRRGKESLKEESKEQKPEREKRESTRVKAEEKKEEEEKRTTRRDKDEDRGSSVKDDKLTPKKDDKFDDKNESKEDSNKKRVTRRKSGRGEEGKKDEEEDEVDDKDQKKKTKDEKKVEEKKLTRQDMKDMKDKKVTKEVKEEKVKEDKIKEDKIKEEKVKVDKIKEDKVEEISVKDDQIVDDENAEILDKEEDSGDEEVEEIDRQGDDEKKKEIPLGTKVKVKYGRGKNIKLYEAKVVESRKESGQKTYLVHYAGWNNRYDEWIKRERIVSIVGRQDSSKKSVNKSPVNVSPKASLKQQLVSQIQKKRGRPNAGTPPPIKSLEFRIPQPRSPVPSTQSKSRPTRSNSLETKVQDLPAKTRKTRRSSGMTDNSDTQSRASDESSDFEEDIEIDDKIPDLSETGSLSKTPERDEQESELEGSMEEAPKLEVMEPLEDLPSDKLTPIAHEDQDEERTPSPKPLIEEPILEPFVLKDKEKTIKDIKERTPKDIKEKAKDVKEKPKEIKEKPKEIKEKVKEVKEKPKEVKEKPKEAKEKAKESKEKVKDVKDVRRLLLSETKPAETKSVSIYDFEDTEIEDDFKIEEKKIEKKESTSEFDIEEIVKDVLAKGDRVEEIQAKLECQRLENEQKKLEIEKQFDQFEELVKNDAKLDIKDSEDGDKRLKPKKKDLKDSVKKDLKDGKRELKRGRPPLDKLQGDLLATPKQDLTQASSHILSSLTKKIIDTPVEEPSETKLKKDVLDSKTKKEKRKESPTLGEDKLSDNESKELNDNLEKKKVKKKVKKKIFGENLNDSSEPLAFSDLTKEHIDKIRPEIKKDVKTPKSACKEKLAKPKESKKLKDSDFSKDFIPLVTCAIVSEVVSEFSENVNHDNKEKRVRSRSASPTDIKAVKLAKVDTLEHKSETAFELNVANVIPIPIKDMKLADTSCESAIKLTSLMEVESNSSVVASLLDDVKARTPEHQKNLDISVPSASKDILIKSRDDQPIISGDHTSNSGSESPTAILNSLTSLEGTESSVQPSSESSNDVETHHVKRKRESEDPTPTKKQKRRTSTKGNKNAERNKSKFNGSDSEDTNSCKFPSPHHTPGSPHKHLDNISRPPRSPKYNFHIEESNYLVGEQKIVFITDKMKEIRKLYLTIKSEVSAIDKRRKRARRKERDNSQSSHLDNESW